MTDINKTIIAIATGASASAIGIIRISGKDSFKGVSRIFSGFENKVEPRKMYYGKISAGEYTDNCMAAYFKAPYSYTGEDGVEIYCHGSYALMTGIVEYLIENAGFVQAEGGDFTARAFANGKLDLTEAEGVLDIINANSEAEIRGAYSLLSGKLKEKITAVQNKIVQTRAKTEAAIDYPEEDVEESTGEEIAADLTEIEEMLGELIGTYKTGRLMRDGVKVALIGKPNAGKSSLMNAMLGYERAIVTAEKGTTRDAVSESYIYKGVKFVLTDTAGIRNAESLPEKMGIERAYRAAKESDVLIAVIEPDGQNEETEKLAKELKNEGRAVIIAENKSDLNKKQTNPAAISISAKTGEGIESLKEEIYKSCGLKTGSGAAINNVRQYSAASAAEKAIARATQNVKTVPPELISADLYEAYTELGKITGITGSDALAEEIFKKFCVGK